jgi:hypothetical protein
VAIDEGRHDDAAAQIVFRTSLAVPDGAIFAIRPFSTIRS